ncbi:MAG: hypothetical protein JW716_01070 [Candidatus Aenigmarchaeota archaeon]|nr:hypothetical protein [Candidatus Aenigmarchaeota archaeon]
MNVKIIVLIILLVFVTAVGASATIKLESEKQIGGEKDEHGCLVPAGYSWDEDVGACIRGWELDEDQKRAAKAAIEYLDSEKISTITEVAVLRCPGCFDVKLEQGEDRDLLSVKITDWSASGKTVLRHTCKPEERSAIICTMEYNPVCGFKEDGTSSTYGNGCGACSDGVVYWESGEC